MVTVGKLLPASVVAHILGDRLGVGRQWIDFLNDCRQQRTAGVFGELLQPYGHQGGDPEHCTAPRYSPRVVLDFIKKVRAAAGTDHPFAVHIEEYTFDDSPAISPAMWRFRRVERVIAPGSTRRA